MSIIMIALACVGLIVFGLYQVAQGSGDEGYIRGYVDGVMDEIAVDNEE